MPNDIPIYSPDGVLGDIPAEDLKLALQSGFTLSPRMQPSLPGNPTGRGFFGGQQRDPKIAEGAANVEASGLTSLPRDLIIGSIVGPASKAAWGTGKIIAGIVGRTSQGQIRLPLKIAGKLTKIVGGDEILDAIIPAHPDTAMINLIAAARERGAKVITKGFEAAAEPGLRFGKAGEDIQRKFLERAATRRTKEISSEIKAAQNLGKIDAKSAEQALRRNQQLNKELLKFTPGRGIGSASAGRSTTVRRPSYKTGAQRVQEEIAARSRVGGGELPTGKVTLQSIPRENIIARIKDPNTPYVDRRLYAEELRRSPGTIPQSEVERLTNVLLGRRGVMPWRNLEK